MQPQRKTSAEIVILKKEYCRLLANGYTQRQASESVGVSEKTGMNWAKKRNQSLSHLLTVKKNIIARLAVETAKPDTLSVDIHNLTTALSVIDKQINSAKP